MRDYSCCKLINGAWQFSIVKDNRLIVRTYYGYTKNEARRAFLDEIK